MDSWKKLFLPALACALLLLTSKPASANSIQPCPAVGSLTGNECNTVLTINPGGTVAITNNTSLPPYDSVLFSGTSPGPDDFLIGVVNNSNKTIFSLVITGPLVNGVGPFGFDNGVANDGACNPALGTPPAGCPFGPTFYEGPGISFSGISPNGQRGIVNFSGGLAPGQTAWFALEGPIGTVAATPDPATLVLLGSGLVGLFGLRRRKIAS